LSLILLFAQKQNRKEDSIYDPHVNTTEVHATNQTPRTMLVQLPERCIQRWPAWMVSRNKSRIRLTHWNAAVVAL